MKPVEHVSVKAGYDRWAPVYELDGNPLIALDDEVIPRLVGDVNDCTVLELACGTGRHTTRLLAAGARVTALDVSTGMLRVAASRPASREARFVCADLSRGLPIGSEHFELVLCCLALEHVRDLHALFAEVRRVLSPNGAFVFSDMHSAMRRRGHQANFDDPLTGNEVRVEGYEHPVTEYVMAAVETGFAIERAEEHVADEVLAQRARKHLGWPMLLAFRLRRS